MWIGWGSSAIANEMQKERHSGKFIGPSGNSLAPSKIAPTRARRVLASRGERKAVKVALSLPVIASEGPTAKECTGSDEFHPM